LLMKVGSVGDVELAITQNQRALFLRGSRMRG